MRFEFEDEIKLPINSPCVKEGGPCYVITDGKSMFFSIEEAKHFPMKDGLFPYKESRRTKDEVFYIPDIDKAIGMKWPTIALESDEYMKATKKQLEKANKTVDAMLEISRIACAPYSLEELIQMLQEGKNPLLGDTPSNKSGGPHE